MGKNKIVSYLFVLLGLLVIVGAAYVIISYVTDVFQAISDFVTTNDYSKLQKCGITPPPQFEKLRADLPTIILPSLYLGMPLLLIIISAIMFLAGYYYHKGRHEDEIKKTQELERKLVHKIVNRIEAEVEEDEPESEPEEEPEPVPAEPEKAAPAKPARKKK